MTRINMSFVAVSVIVLSFAGCGGSDSGSVQKPVEIPAKPVEPAPPEPAQVDPGPTASEAFAWVLGKINGGGVVSDAEITQRFAPAFLAQLPPARIKEVFAALSVQLAPVTVKNSKDVEPRGLSALLDTAAGGIRATLQMRAKSPAQIETLLFKPASSETPPKSYEQAVGMLDKLGAKTLMSVSEIKRGRCTPVKNRNATSNLAIGSTFKLWVLAALDRKIRGSKSISWDSKIAVRDAQKNFPYTDLSKQPDGTELTLREFASVMISQSDNSATDHLINYMGRSTVEAELRRSGHKRPKTNTPFLTTRELFALKISTTEAELNAYRKASVSGKRKLIKTIGKRPLDIEKAKKKITGPTAIDIEWFADGRDLCGVFAMIGKANKWKTDSQALKILAINPGVAYDKDRFKYVGFKGGSEPGVVNLSFLVQRSDGRWFVVALTVNDETKMGDANALVNIAAGLLAIVGASK